MALKTVSIPGVELLAIGTWQGHNCPDEGCKLTIEDLDAMVESYEATKDSFSAPVKLGHDDQQKLLQTDGYPAAGWVVNLRRSGGKLLGDLKDVPAAIAELIKVGAYRKRSSELRPDAEVNGRKFKWVFSGLALLGADLPAVEGLADIEKLYASMRLEKEPGTEVLYFEAANPVESIISRLESLVSEAEDLIRGQKGAPTLRRLVQAAKEELRRVAKIPSKETKMTIDEKALRAMLGLGDEDDVLDAITKLKNVKPTDSPETDELKKELSATQARLLTLETHNVKTAAEAAVTDAITAGKLLPAQRETALAFATRDVEGFAKFVEAQPSVIELGERGSSGGKGTQPNLADLEPTAEEISAAKALGLWSDTYKVSLMRTRAEQRGIELPLNFGKKDSDKKD